MAKSSLYVGVVATVCLLLAVGLGLGLYYGLNNSQESTGDAVADCIPEGDATQEKCDIRGCVWVGESSDGAPYCIFPDTHGYKQHGDRQDTALGYVYHLRREDTPSLFGDDLMDIDCYIDFHTESRLRVRFVDPAETRYQVPREAVDIAAPSTPPTQTLYDVTVTDTRDLFGVKVTRRSNGAVLFDSSVPGFTFSDQYIQLTTRLSSPHIYGFGEHNHRRFKHDMNWRKWSIFTRDVAPVDDWNLYGAQPFYMNLEEDGQANGALLLNSNAMDIVLQPPPHPAISYHVIGGVLDFYIFLGPSPEKVVQQYTLATGRPAMLPYWSLGFQLSRWDYDNLTHVKHVVERNIDADIPLDTQYGDIDYMESKLDFTINPVAYDGLQEFVEELHDRGMRYIIILDHCIGSNETLFAEKLRGNYPPYSEGVRDEVFIRDPRDTDKYLEGEVWPGPVHYPDFSNLSVVVPWWRRQCDDLYSTQRLQYDALWIDMNEPSNFVPGSTTQCDTNKWNYPPYVPRILGAVEDGRMYDKTICMDADTAWGRQYDTHSLYGHAMSITTYTTLLEQFPTKRPLVLTRSNFVGTQRYAMHWLGDNQSLWEQMPWSIIGMLEYSLFGFSYTGADICGFWFAATEEMCQRWMQLGAFYPFARNHNGETWPDQDPAAFSDDMIAVSRDVLRTRYTLLPYLYTLILNAHAHGDTVVRPLMHEFSTDKLTWSVDTQFLWGAAFMVSPAMSQGQTVVDAYFPKARWYNYYGGAEVQDTGRTHSLDTPLEKINLHVRGGYILPTQQPANNTRTSRELALGVIVALDEDGKAEGKLFWDDGESFETYEKGDFLQADYSCSNNVLSMVVSVNGSSPALHYGDVTVWGLERRPSDVTVDGVQLSTDQYSFGESTMELRLFGLSLELTVDHEITWDLS